MSLRDCEMSKRPRTDLQDDPAYVSLMELLTLEREEHAQVLAELRKLHAKVDRLLAAKRKRKVP